MFNVATLLLTMHSSQRRHWPMAQLTKRCDSLPQRSRIVRNCQHW